MLKYAWKNLHIEYEVGKDENNVNKYLANILCITVK